MAENRRKRTWYVERQKQRRRSKIQRWVIGIMLAAGLALLAAAVVPAGISALYPAPVPTASNADDLDDQSFLSDREPAGKEAPPTAEDLMDGATVAHDFSNTKDWAAARQGFGIGLKADTGQQFGIRSNDPDKASVVDGAFVAGSTTYLEAKAGAPLERIGAEFSLDDDGGELEGRGTLALIEWQDGGAVNNRLNRTWGRTVAHVTINHKYVRLDYQHKYPHGKAAVYNVGEALGDGTWELPYTLPQDGSPIIADLAIDRVAGVATLTLISETRTQTVEMDYPEIITSLPALDYSTSSAYVPTADDFYACWEPYYRDPKKDSRVTVHKVWALAA